MSEHPGHEQHGHEHRLIWIDLEMTGLDTDRDSILEIATVVTDAQLNVLAEGPELAIAHPLERLQAMDEWNRNQHGKSGLWQRVLEQGVAMEEAERRTLAFLADWVAPNASVTVTGAPSGTKLAVVYSTSATAPTCSKSSAGTGFTSLSVSGSSFITPSTLPPNTYYFHSWNQSTGVCAYGGRVVVGGLTAYTLPFSSTTPPAVGP